ncbi:MAG TPA: hypothetical protein QF753_20365 [Victivallales bacterium]|nr:hypothetical protein [Victivallales bacterium]
MLKFNHVGIPTNVARENGIYYEGLKLYVYRDASNSYDFQWERCEADSPLPKLVKEVAHISYEVDDINEAIKGEKVIFEPYNLDANITIAFIEVDGAPIEFLKIN